MPSCLDWVLPQGKSSHFDEKLRGQKKKLMKYHKSSLASPAIETPNDNINVDLIPYYWRKKNLCLLFENLIKHFPCKFE